MRRSDAPSFRAQVYQSPYLPETGTEVQALIAVRAEGLEAPEPEAVEVILVDCSGSMDHPPQKMEAARVATGAALDRLRDGTWFAVVAGTRRAELVYPADGRQLLAASAATRKEARDRVSRLTATDGTAISTWLALARQLFAARPHALKHALLLTDGRNQHETPETLAAELERCRGVFACDCRGVGADWNEKELRGIAHALLGDCDIIPKPSEMAAEFERIVERTMGRRIGSVEVVVETPVSVTITTFEQGLPEIEDLSDRVSWTQPDGAGTWRQVPMPDPDRPLRSVFPTGAWTTTEEREYYLCLDVTPRPVGPQSRMRAARVAVVVGGEEIHQTHVIAEWTDDLPMATRTHERLTAYVTRSEMVQHIQKGVRAREAGKEALATTLLLRAHQLSVETGNPAVTRLIERLIDVDRATGRATLRPDVTPVDSMTVGIRAPKVTGTSVAGDEPKRTAPPPVAETTPDGAPCPTCGTTREPEDRFCAVCGYEFTRAAEAPAASDRDADGGEAG